MTTERDWSDVFTSQGVLAATRQARKRQARLLPQRPSEGTWPCPHLDFKCLASRTVNEEMSIVLSYSEMNTICSSTDMFKLLYSATLFSNKILQGSPVRHWKNSD